MREIPVNGWLECQKCSHIFRGLVLVCSLDSEEPDEVIPQLPEQPCPTCGSMVNAPWDMPDSLDNWLITVDETVASCEADRDRIGAVFVASACEVMLREIIEFGLQKQNVSPKLISYLLDKAQGREKLCELYNAVATNRIAAVLKEAALLPWFEAWDRLVKARNKFAHGKQTSEGLTNAIHIVARYMDKALVSLRNAILVPNSKASIEPESKSGQPQAAVEEKLHTHIAAYR
jgi:hypothetical protein